MQEIPQRKIPAYITSLIRHFEDLRDGTHGGSASRQDKEAHFEKAVQLLAPIARQVLTEMNTSLLLGTGQLTETGLQRTADGGLDASWALSWPEQRASGVQPHAPSLFRRRLPSPASSRNDRSRLASERVQRRGCRGPVIDTKSHRLQRPAQFGLSRGLSDRPCGDGKFP
jgi:hypothetical protein